MQTFLIETIQNNFSSSDTEAFWIIIFIFYIYFLFYSIFNIQNDILNCILIYLFIFGGHILIIKYLLLFLLCFFVSYLYMQSLLDTLC